MKKVISAGIIIFRRTSEGIKYLLLYHGRGYWNFPKGKMEKEERSWQTALREIYEETGLRKNELRFQPNFKTFERFTFGGQRNPIFKIVILYLAETSQARIRISGGGHEEGFGWFTAREAQRLLVKYKDSVAILRRAHAFLHQRKEEQKPVQEMQDIVVPPEHGDSTIIAGL